jgi:hypothetical protein
MSPYGDPRNLDCGFSGKSRSERSSALPVVRLQDKRDTAVSSGAGGTRLEPVFSRGHLREESAEARKSADD